MTIFLFQHFSINNNMSINIIESKQSLETNRNNYRDKFIKEIKHNYVHWILPMFKHKEVHKFSTFFQCSMLDVTTLVVTQNGNENKIYIGVNVFFLFFIINGTWFLWNYLISHTRYWIIKYWFLESHSLPICFIH